MAMGMNKRTAFRFVLPGVFSDTTIYRLWNNFLLRQGMIRTFLSRLGNLSICKGTAAFETISHLREAFGKAPCAVDAFQSHFQADFL